jgi:hypothetical protein
MIYKKQNKLNEDFDFGNVKGSDMLNGFSI